MQSNRAIFRIYAGSRAGFFVPLTAVSIVVVLQYSPVLILIGAVLGLGIYFFDRPFELLLVTAFLIPFNFVFLVGTLPVAAELLKVILWVPFIIHLVRRRKGLIRSQYQLAFCLIFALLLLSILRAISLPFTIKECIRTASSIGLSYIVITLVDDQKKFVTLIRVIVISCVLVAVYGFYQFAIQDYGWLFSVINPRLDTPLAPNRSAFWEWRNRMMSVLTSEQELGEYFNYCLPLAGTLALTSTKKRSFYVGSTCVLIILAGLALTFTFGAWIALATTAGFFVLLFRRYLQWNAIVAGLLILVSLTGIFLYTNGLDSIVNHIGELGVDYLTRYQLWTLSWQLFLSHPLFGVGFGNLSMIVAAADFPWLSQEWVTGGATAHNMYLTVLSQLGLLGFICVFGVFVHSALTMLKLGRKGGEYRIYCFCIAFGILTFLIGGITDDAAIFGAHASTLIWLLVALSEVTRNLNRSRATTEFGVSSS